MSKFYWDNEKTPEANLAGAINCLEDAFNNGAVEAAELIAERIQSARVDSMGAPVDTVCKRLGEIGDRLTEIDTSNHGIQKLLEETLSNEMLHMLSSQNAKLQHDLNEALERVAELEAQVESDI